jgi:hypothetical protein
VFCSDAPMQPPPSEAAAADPLSKAGVGSLKGSGPAWLDRAAIDVLARATDAASASVMVYALRRYDPFVRGRVRRRVQSWLDRVSAASPPEAVVDEDARVAAALRLAVGAGSLGGDDAAATVRLAESNVDKRRQFWPFSTALLGTIVAAAAVTAFLLLRPSSEEKFRRSPLGKAMNDALTDYVVAVNRGQKGRAEDSRSGLVDDAVRAQIGQEAADDLERVLERMRKLRDEERDARGASDALQTALGKLDLALADAHVPAYFDAYSDGDQSPRAVWLTGYYVGERSSVALGDAKFSVVWGRRLDHLNLLTPSAVRRARDREVLVSLDRAEEVLIRIDLPAFSSEPKLGAWENVSRSMPPALARALGLAVAEELPAAAKVEARTLTELYDAVEAREFELDRASGHSMTSKRTLAMPGSMRASLAKMAEKDPRASAILRHDDRVDQLLVPGRKAAAVVARIVEQGFLRRLALEAAPLTPTADIPTPVTQRSLGALRAGTLFGLLSDASLPPSLVLAWAAEQVYGDGDVALANVLAQLDVAVGGGAFDPEGEDDLAFRSRFVHLVEKRGELRAAAASLHAKWFGAPAQTYARTVHAE